MAKLIFEDTFEGNEIDFSKWEKCPESYRCPYYDVYGVKWDNDCSYLDGNGHLILHAKWDDSEKIVRAGAVRTKGKFTCGLSYMEASVKFPVATGTWGAFWSMVGTVANEDGSSEDGIEIDVIESIMNEKGCYNHALHWDGYKQAHKSESERFNAADGIDIYDGNFHTFAVWRRSDCYIFYIDGKETWRTTAAGICKEQGYLKLTVEANTFNGSETPEAIAELPADMVVDYVRVYDVKPQ